jgi:hypothetical protein
MVELQFSCYVLLLAMEFGMRQARPVALTQANGFLSKKCRD